MLADDRVPAGRGQGCHVKGVSNIGSAAGNSAPAAHLPGISIDRGDADKGCDAPPVELSKLRQIGDQGACGDVSDPWHRCQQVIGRAPDWRAFHGVADLALQLGKLGFKGLQRRLDGALDARIARRPVARAKSRIWRGLTTASGKPAPAKAAATVISNPPVASSTISAGAKLRSSLASRSRPLPSRGTAKLWPDGRT